jgi:hypothetical protein
MRPASTGHARPAPSRTEPPADTPGGHAPASVGRSDWRVLLIGGHSGAGKSTVAERLARRHGTAWLMVDDLRLALQRSRAVLPTPEATAALHFDKRPGWWRVPPEAPHAGCRRRQGEATDGGGQDAVRAPPSAPSLTTSGARRPGSRVKPSGRPGGHGLDRRSRRASGGGRGVALGVPGWGPWPLVLAGSCPTRCGRRAS